jgi:uncharacterized protein YbaP (TraB family)
VTNPSTLAARPAGTLPPFTNIQPRQTPASKEIYTCRVQIARTIASTGGMTLSHVVSAIIFQQMGLLIHHPPSILLKANTMCNILDDVCYNFTRRMTMKQTSRRYVLFVTVIISSLLFGRVWSNDTGKAFLWQIEKGGKNSYLLGSIHFLKKESYPLKKIIEKSYAKSEVLVLEIDFSSANLMQMPALVKKKAQYGEGETLKDNLSPKSYQLVKRELKKRYNIDIEDYQKFKAWYVAMEVESRELQKLGFSPFFGIDMYFLNKSTGKKDLAGLETIEFQLNLLDSFSKKEQELFLIHTLKETGQFAALVDKIVKYWTDGDADKMAALLEEDNQKAPKELEKIGQKLLDKRNITMTKSILDLLKKDKSYFIVVGAAHLVGEKGIVSLLQKEGLKLKQL